ncbi:hypothetical protein [Streptomyces gilvus]|uniref:hypothetical protein n=1 Tax=Streptomyces gilvus TaxID=2920937 RepID=UPI001F10C12A|nr:hypothetical protein [Streptomyces sp. CME 23]MCH5676864.1 hypothetical protein [Streptomyces sp. CME 23]
MTEIQIEVDVPAWMRDVMVDCLSYGRQSGRFVPPGCVTGGTTLCVRTAGTVVLLNGARGYAVHGRDISVDTMPLEAAVVHGRGPVDLAPVQEPMALADAPAPRPADKVRADKERHAVECGSSLVRLEVRICAGRVRDGVVRALSARGRSSSRGTRRC